MDEIVLNVDLKFVLATLSMSEKGELLTALLEGVYSGENQALLNVYQYIMKLQENRRAQKKRMRELSAKGVEARLKKRTEQSRQNDSVNRRLLRKEAKESEFKNKYNLNLFSFDEHNQPVLQSAKAHDFAAPSVDEVQRYIDANGFKVNAENFVNFYESHGWMVGSTPIKNWQATVKLWHARANQAILKSSSAESDDETYWHELKQRLQTGEKNAACAEKVPKSVSARQNLAHDAEFSAEQLKSDGSSPFARFMHRVEKYDINRENDNDK